MKCGVYLIRNLVDGHLYVGSSKNIPSRWRNHRTGHGSTIYLTRAIKKHGVENFEFAVLEECEVADLPRVEGEWIELLGTVFPGGYNLSSFTANGGQVRHPDVIARQAAKLKGRVMSPEWREKLAAAKRGKKQSAETIAKRIAKTTGKKRSEEFRRKAAEMRAKHPPLSDEGRRRMSEAKKGKQLSPGHCLKLSKTTTAYWMRRKLEIGNNG